ncbi:MAG: ABC transporter ATP-binding protein [Ignavibacteriales bacterium]|nr:ABC transporter ATP-binding protein [Ignavibacteriales bacterium]
MQKSRFVGRFDLSLHINFLRSMDNSPAIEVNSLVKVFAKRDQRTIRAVDGLSIRVPKGSIFGLLGPNGAGKTTTIRILTTLLTPSAGEARVMGYDVVQNPLAVRRQICVVVQENAIELHLSVQNNFRVFGRFHGLHANEIQRRTERISELFGLREYLNEKGMDLSGGLKRRVQVAKTFLIDKPVVFLDEATTGMDTFNKRTTIQAIKEESRKGRTIVLTTHVLDEAEVLCDSIAIMNHGKLVAQGTVDSVKAYGLRMMSLSMLLTEVSSSTLDLVRSYQPSSIDVKNTTLDITVKDDNTALAILAAVRRHTEVRHFEITTASLEDVFIQLLDKKASPS